MGFPTNTKTLRFPTDNEVTVLKILSTEPKGLIGLDVHRKTAIRRGSVYYILERMEQEGWLKFRTLQPPSRCGGHPRKVYRMTERGRHVLNYAKRYSHG